MKRYIMLVLILVLVLVGTVGAGAYKWVDKNGVVNFSDTPPVGVKAEYKEMRQISSAGPSSGWNEAARGIAPKVPIKKEVPVVQPVQQVQQVSQEYRAAEQAWHRGSKPRKPINDYIHRDFNRATDQWGQYEEKMFEWRSRGRELGVR